MKKRLLNTSTRHVQAWINLLECGLVQCDEHPYSMSKYAISDIKTDLETRDILFELKPTLPHEVHYKVITTKTVLLITELPSALLLNDPVLRDLTAVVTLRTAILHQARTRIRIPNTNTQHSLEEVCFLSHV
jgi:hypothetical protein